ncbi:response regulator transcription factor [Candidatus Sumerlaeota bacterium]|nr:response regulator transcription factor [Candidatus Sumerlaeota bacterium]MBI3735214.1 response regulator transcription factor [Candidatus Sumerlaeota bacterium]
MATKQQILIVEDEEDILELVAYNLTKAGFQVRGVETGEEALKALRGELPNLIILDLMLPGLDGLEVCKTLRADERAKNVPILMLTAKGEESDIITGLELGADDYVAKPFSPKVLIARIRAVLRRKSKETVDEKSVHQIHEIVIHPGRHEVMVKGKPIELSFTEFRVLEYLARRPGWVFTRNQIIEAVRGTGYPVTDRSVDVQIVGLRKKLGAAGDYIETVRGIGYRFKE